MERVAPGENAVPAREWVEIADVKPVGPIRAARGGFTLVEIAFSVLIMTVLAVSVLAVFWTNTRAQTSNRDRETARIAASSKMEEILAWLDYDTLVATFTNPPHTPFAADDLVEPGGGPPGTVIIDDTDPDLLQIAVRVTWIGPSNIVESFELTTALANPNP